MGVHVDSADNNHTTTSWDNRSSGRWRIVDEGHGYDTFGLSELWLQRTLPYVRTLYERYFRVTRHNPENILLDGPAILAANHSGTLPFDGVMLFTDIALNTDRIARPVADRFVPMLPIVSTFMARVGVVSGTRANVQVLLERGELLMIFPEGVGGIGKPFSKRYELQTWRVGHAEFAIRYGVPIIPVAIVGAEEQMPQIARLPIRAFGSPYLPVTATPFPLPVHYHIYYGAPLHPGASAAYADDPESVDILALRVKNAVQDLIRRGLRERKGVFQ